MRTNITRIKKWQTGPTERLRCPRRIPPASVRSGPFYKTGHRVFATISLRAVLQFRFDAAASFVVRSSGFFPAPARAARRTRFPGAIDLALLSTQSISLDGSTHRWVRCPPLSRPPGRPRSDPTVSAMVRPSAARLGSVHQFVGLLQCHFRRVHDAPFLAFSRTTDRRCILL